MKRFLLIIGIAALLFITLAMLEEHETFTRNWFKPPEPFKASEQERRSAAEAVYTFRTLAAHWYATGGDARFGQRLPATEPVVEELRGDIDYVRRNGRIEIPRLMRADVLAADVTGDATAEVRTREYWITEFHWAGGGASDETRSDLIFARYHLTKDGTRWIVAAWDPIDAPQGEETR